MHVATDDVLLDSADVARLLKIKIGTVHGWRQTGEGPVYCKVGNGPNALIRYRRQDVVAFIDKRLRSQTK
jgi:hypothetical protein